MIGKEGEMTESNYNDCIAQHGGYLVRFLQTIDGFRVTHKTWPNRVRMDTSAYKALSWHLTPLGMEKVKEKVQIEVCEGTPLLASNDAAEIFQYTWGVGEPDQRAEQWLGLAS